MTSSTWSLAGARLDVVRGEVLAVDQGVVWVSSFDSPAEPVPAGAALAGMPDEVRELAAKGER